MFFELLLHGRIEKGPVVVHINAAQGEWKQFLQHPQGCHHRGSVTVQQGEVLAPSRRDVCGDKGLEKATFHPCAAMRDQVDFHPSR